MKITLALSIAALIFCSACSATSPVRAQEPPLPVQEPVVVTQRTQPTSGGMPDLVLFAMGFFGANYKYGGNTPESGFDCSGFVRHVFKQAAGLLLPRSSYEISHSGTQIDSGELLPGDLVFFNTLKRAFSHVGIYVGEGRFIHSPRLGKTVEISSMNETYWRNKFDGARRMSLPIDR
jgi:cell wall-associated NlpC family hydrolase